MISWIKMKLTAQRLGIRDRGNIKSFFERGREMVTIHPPCNTRLRIGINSNGDTVTWCWRCERHAPVQES